MFKENTIGYYLQFSDILFGEDSKASKFLRDKAKDSPNGLNEELICTEAQLINILTEIEWGKK